MSHLILRKSDGN